MTNLRTVVWLLALAACPGTGKAQEPTVATTPVPRPDKQAVHERLVAGIQAQKPDLIFIGDSITENFTRQGKAMWDRHYAARNAFNLGVGADRTQHVLWRLENGELDGISPRLAVILIGTNNAGNTPPEDIAAGIAAIVNRVSMKLPETRILLMGIFPRGEKPDDPKRIAAAQVNERIARFSDGKKVFFLDLTQRFLAPDGTIPRDLMADFLHPTERGHEIWAEAIEPMVAGVMGIQ
jgi:lysophospholipase L1-like esterase